MATIRKRGRSWQAQIRLTGFPVLSKSFRSKQTADAWVRQTEAALEREGLRIDLGRLKESTVGDLLRRYALEVSPSKKSADREAFFLAELGRSPMACLRLDRVRSEHVAAYRDQRLRAIKPASVCRELALLRHVFEVARRDWGFPLGVNPAKEIRFPRLPAHRARRPTTLELERLLELAKRSRNKLLAPAIVLALETGMRRGEMLAARWSELDWEKATLLLPVTKNGHPRQVPLSRMAMATLSALPRLEDKIVPLTPTAVRLAWTRLTKKALVADLHFHDLRHEAISRFFEKGLSIAEVAMISSSIRRLVIRK